MEIIQEDDVWQIYSDRWVKMSHLHTNACGDFTLLSREGWDSIRGYPEFEAYFFNIDSMGLIAAHYAGYQEVSLLPPCICFHIEHGMESGWALEGENKLFHRLRNADILNPEWPVLIPLVDEIREKGKSLEFNHEGWVMADFDLPEQVMGDNSVIPANKLQQLALQAEKCGVSAIQPVYDLDRLTLAHERRLVSDEVEKVIIFIPDSNGIYSEENSISYRAKLLETIALVFYVGKFAHQFPLCFDPCQTPSLINIKSITNLIIYRNYKN